MARKTTATYSPKQATGGFPAYLQASVAIVALVFAVWSVNAWKEQEATKKRSEITYELLTRANYIKVVLNPIRGFVTAYSQDDIKSPEFLQGIYTDDDAQEIVALLPKAVELGMYGEVAKTVFEKFVADQAEIVSRSVQTLVYCYSYIRALDRMPAAKRDEQWTKYVHFVLKQINHLPEGMEVSDMDGEGFLCGFDDERFNNALEALVTAVEPALRFTLH